MSSSVNSVIPYPINRAPATATTRFSRLPNTQLDHVTFSGNKSSNKKEPDFWGTVGNWIWGDKDASFFRRAIGVIASPLILIYAALKYIFGDKEDFKPKSSSSSSSSSTTDTQSSDNTKAPPQPPQSETVNHIQVDTPQKQPTPISQAKEALEKIHADLLPQLKDIKQAFSPHAFTEFNHQLKAQHEQVKQAITKIDKEASSPEKDLYKGSLEAFSNYFDYLTTKPQLPTLKQSPSNHRELVEFETDHVIPIIKDIDASHRLQHSLESTLAVFIASHSTDKPINAEEQAYIDKVIKPTIKQFEERAQNGFNLKIKLVSKVYSELSTWTNFTTTDLEKFVTTSGGSINTKLESDGKKLQEASYPNSKIRFLHIVEGEKIKGGIEIEETDYSQEATGRHKLQLSLNDLYVSGFDVNGQNTLNNIDQLYGLGFKVSSTQQELYKAEAEGLSTSLNNYLLTRHLQASQTGQRNERPDYFKSLLPTNPRLKHLEMSNEPKPSNP